MPANSTFETSEWRLLNSEFDDGPTNMAIDEAILEAIAAGDSPPTLRFYRWNPHCLSLGFRQKWEIVNIDSCKKAGWDIVRRPTGGRAILHGDELTYSVSAPTTEPRVRGGVLESYQRLSKALFAGLELMGLSPARAEPPAHNGSTPSPACFDEPSNYEIIIAGRKLIGSAQVRKKGIVLQHGTLPLGGDLTRIVEALNLPDGEDQRYLTEQLGMSATTLEEALGYAKSYEESCEALTQGFSQTLSLSLKPGRLTADEKLRVNRLVKEKYANDNWTRRL